MGRGCSGEATSRRPYAVLLWSPCPQTPSCQPEFSEDTRVGLVVLHPFSAGLQLRLRTDSLLHCGSDPWLTETRPCPRACTLVAHALAAALPLSGPLSSVTTITWKCSVLLTADLSSPPTSPSCTEDTDICRFSIFKKDLGHTCAPSLQFSASVKKTLCFTKSDFLRDYYKNKK